MSITKIFQSIQNDLVKVEDCLRESAAVDIPLLAQLLDYVTQNSGKRIRPALTLLCGKTCHYDLTVLVPMASSIELLHTATLVHDDIVDNSPTRRGKQSVYHAWGEDSALLLGDYLFAKAGSLAASTGSLRVVELFAQTLMTISGGELGQIGIDYRLSEAQDRYYRWISAKTASLFSMATESGAILSRCSEDTITILKGYGHNLGMAFQVVDDILDFIGDKTAMGKPVGSDLSEGAVTLPSILFALSHPKDTLIKSIIKEKKRDTSLIEQAVDRVRDSGVIDTCFTVASDYCSRACTDLHRIGDKQTSEALQNLATYVIERNK